MSFYLYLLVLFVSFSKFAMFLSFFFKHFYWSDLILFQFRFNNSSYFLFLANIY